MKLTQVGATLAWCLNELDNEAGVLKVLESAEKVSAVGDAYPVYLCAPLVTPTGTHLGKHPFLRTRHPVSNTMFLCATKWMKQAHLFR